jgi:hypothetical protein
MMPELQFRKVPRWRDGKLTFRPTHPTNGTHPPLLRFQTPLNSPTRDPDNNLAWVDTRYLTQTCMNTTPKQPIPPLPPVILPFNVLPKHPPTVFLIKIRQIILADLNDVKVGITV